MDEPLRRDHRAARRVRRHGRRRPTRRSPCSRTTTGKICGVQFHPEVVHSPHGMAVLRRFLHELAGCAPTWTMASVIDEQVELIRAQVGDGRVICALSGGVDSSVAAALVHRGDRPPAHVRLRRHRADAQGRERAGRRDVPAQPGHRADPRRRRRPLLRRAGRRHRAGGQAQGDRRAVHPGLRGEHRRADRGRVPRAGHAVPRPHRERRHRRHGGGDQEPPQRRWAPRGHDARARRAAARPVQGRGAQARHRARPARRDGLAPAVPRARARRADHRRGHARAGRRAAGGRRHRARGDRRRPGSSGRSGSRSPCSPTSARSA